MISVFFWDITQRVVVNSLTNFRDNLWVPSSGTLEDGTSEIYIACLLVEHRDGPAIMFLNDKRTDIYYMSI